jgi:hypothetical protein
MARNDVYPTDLTREETDLGFQRLLISNPRRAYFGQRSLIPVVAYVVGPMDHIIKTRDPDGNLAYSHRQFGHPGIGGAPDWSPVLIDNPSATQAVRLAKTGLDERMARQAGLGLDPALPTLALRCPDCAHHFAVWRDHLGMAEMVVCPQCQKPNPAPEMFAVDS